MENRVTKYFAKKPEIIQTRMNEIKEKIIGLIEKNQDNIFEDFREAFNKSFQQGIKMQKVGEKEEIAFVCISILRTALLTKTYDLRIDLYDKKLFFDSTECVSNWNAGFAYQYLDDDQAYFTKCARKELIRLQDAEMIMFMQEYQESYFDTLEAFCMKNIGQILKLPSWEALKKTEDIKIFYGEFQDRCVELKINPQESTL